MCRKLAWSQPAESRAHQWPSAKTGIAPAAPNRIMAYWLGAPSENSPDIPMCWGSTTSIATYRKALPTITAWRNPMSLPRPRTSEVSPHIPGRLRPQLRQTSSLTPTSLPQEGQRTEPERWRRSMERTLSQEIILRESPGGPAPWSRDRGGPARPPEPPGDRRSAAAPREPRDRPAARPAWDRRWARGDRGRGGGRGGPRRCGSRDSARHHLRPGRSAKIEPRIR